LQDLLAQLMLTLFAMKELKQQPDQPAASAWCFLFFQKFGHSSLAALSGGASKSNI
jgi:hypothetical protein